MKLAQDIIKAPVLTEKSYDLIPSKKYTFEVAKDAHKTEIKAVKVDKVNTIRTQGKKKRQGYTQGTTPEVKKAIVTLKKDSKGIEFFDGMMQ